MATDQLIRPTQLETLFPGLHASPPAALPFAPALSIRAFLLERDHGNLLVYSAPSVPGAAAAIHALGGVSWHYLNHWHESLLATDAIAAEFGAPVVVHASDAAEVAERAGVEPVTFDHRGTLGEGFEIVPIPGHTPGATAFLWEHGDHRFLFTGDTLSLSGGEWVTAVLDSSDRAAYLESLALIRDLDFDVLVPWTATAGESPVAVTDPAATRRRIDAAIRRVRNG